MAQETATAKQENLNAESWQLTASPEKVTLATGAIHLAAVGDARRYAVTIIKAGENKNGWVMPAEVLGANIAKFAAAPCQIDHHGWFDFPSLERTAGTIEDPYLEDQELKGYLRLTDTPAGELLQRILDAWLADKEAGLQVVDVGLSAVLWLKWKPRESWDEPSEAADIKMVESVDAVLHPAAGGRVERVLNSYQGAEPPGRSNIMPDEVLTQEGGEQTEQAPEQNQTTAENNGSNIDQIRRLADHLESLQSQVERLTGVVADQAASRTIQGMGEAPRDNLSVRMGRTGLEQVEEAFNALMEGRQPAAGVQPLSGIRELYHLLSGDWEMTGRFQNDRVYLANVNSSTMAALVANALNKVVVNVFQNYPRWWEPIVVEMDFSTLQDARWITLGGVGELPTVSEGAAYTELTWDDNTETASFVKKGGYLGITIEAIDKDDTRRLRMAPAALAQAAWLTLSKSVSNIFTSNSGVGPTMADSVALFNAAHSNLGSTALSHAAWVTTRRLMRDQTELNSSEALGALTAPRYLLVPNELEVTALQVMATEMVPGGSNFNENPFAEGDAHMARMMSARERVIVIDLWTDADDWAAVADPNLYPSIAIGYRYGRVPEIFSVASPTAGLMFSNDVMPVKVRFFYATGPTDYRGLYKHNV